MQSDLEGTGRNFTIYQRIADRFEWCAGGGRGGGEAGRRGGGEAGRRGGGEACPVAGGHKRRQNPAVHKQRVGSKRRLLSDHGLICTYVHIRPWSDVVIVVNKDSCVAANTLS